MGGVTEVQGSLYLASRGGVRAGPRYKMVAMQAQVHNTTVAMLNLSSVAS